MFETTNKQPSRNFVVIRDLIKEKTGIFIRDSRSDYLEYRLRDRMAANSIEDFEEYYYYLKYSPKHSGELQSLINLITVHETSFFRNPDQLNSFKNVILKDIVDNKKKEGKSELRVWSAACSTGEESLTLAMILYDALTYMLNWNIEILATDISTRALETARKGQYPEYRFRDMPPLTIARYFKKNCEGYLAANTLLDLINYKHLNLACELEDFIAERLVKYDVIFCRNVFIYFTEEVKLKIAKSFYDALNPGGYLLLGNAESIDIRKVPFDMAFLPGGVVYKKP